MGINYNVSYTLAPPHPPPPSLFYIASQTTILCFAKAAIQVPQFIREWAVALKCLLQANWRQGYLRTIQSHLTTSCSAKLFAFPSPLVKWVLLSPYNNLKPYMVMVWQSRKSGDVYIMIADVSMTSCNTLTGVQEMHGWIHPKYFVAHDPFSSSTYPMNMYTHHEARNLPIITWVAKQLPRM